MQYSRGKKHSKSSLNRIKKKLKVEHALSLASIFLVVYFGYILLLSDKNIFHYMQKVIEKKELQAEISKLKKENEKLKNNITYLKKDPFFIEKKAREDLGLKKENEEIFIIIGEKEKEKEDSFFGSAGKWINKMIHKYSSKE